MKASPTKGESICVHPELFHGPDVLPIAVVMVCRDRRCGSVKNSSRLRGKSVPHAGGAAPNPCGAFNLRRSGCGPEYERGRKGLRCNQGIPVDRDVVVHLCLHCEDLQTRVGRLSHFRVVAPFMAGKIAHFGYIRAGDKGTPGPGDYDYAGALDQGNV